MARTSLCSGWKTEVLIWPGYLTDMMIRCRSKLVLRCLANVSCQLRSVIKVHWVELTKGP